ncbi:hypothetical protein AMJ51_00630 [Microgenomates bacterium DG_75]|nr:MAG: hypothetical protein AMJ51_00630 [Microgenomates bacterium DG_75]
MSHLVERFYYRRRMQKRYSEEEINSLLTDLQKEVLKLTATGLSNSEISDRLGIEDHVVEYHLSGKDGRYGIFPRLNAFSRREAVAKAIALGILNPEDFVTDKEIERCKNLQTLDKEILSWLSNPSLPSQRITIVEVGEKVGLSKFTVKHHLQSIYDDLKIKDDRGVLKSTRAIVIYLAYRQSLISPSQERLQEPSKTVG